jgi:hypothetical protein
MSDSFKVQLGGGADPASAAQLLGEMRALGRQTSSARRGYWLPLLLFGVLIAASLPMYRLAAIPLGITVRSGPPTALPLFGGGYFGIYVGSGWLALYWLLAIQAGIGATVLWYRWRGLRTGLRTPTRALLVSGLVVTELALFLSLFGQQLGLVLFGQLFNRGTFPLLILAVPLAALALMERSFVLAVIVATYSGLALLACLYDVQNVLFRLGWNPLSTREGITLTSVPNVALPALFLLLAGAGAWLAPRLRWRLRRQPAGS